MKRIAHARRTKQTARRRKQREWLKGIRGETPPPPPPVPREVILEELREKRRWARESRKLNRTFLRWVSVIIVLMGAATIIDGMPR